MLVAAPTMGMAETVSLGGTDYEVVTVTDGEIGPAYATRATACRNTL